MASGIPTSATRLRNFTIIFKDRDKYEDVTIQASQVNITEAFVALPTFRENGEYSCISYALPEVFRIEEN